MFVRLWMSKDPIVVSIDQSVAEAQQCLQENSIRRIPVVDGDNKLVGIISREDIYNVLPSVIDGSSAGISANFSESTKVAEIMTAKPMYVEPMTSLETVAKRMRKHKVGGMPVLEDGHLVGIITESDIFLAFMEILGVGDETTRVEMLIGKSSKELYQIFEIFKRHKMDVHTIAIHNDYSKSQRLLTVRIVGESLNSSLEALRKAGVQINRIQVAEDP